jgi:hypothetical protein
MDLDRVRRDRTILRVTDKKTGDPKDGEQHVGGRRFMPIAAPLSRIAIIVPGPLTAGPPKPEPEQRWTLGPGRRPEPPVEPGVDRAVEGVPLEPVRAKVARPAATEGEADPS